MKEEFWIPAFAGMTNGNQTETCQNV